MERKKKRDKFLANGGEGDSIAAQPGDVHPWQREAEQQGNAKKLAVSGGPNGDSPTQTFLPSVNWSHTHPQSVPSQQNVHASMPQQQHPTSQQGLQAGTQQPLPPGQQPVSGWHNPEISGQSMGAGHYPFHLGSADSNWKASNYGGTQGMGGGAAPYSYPGGFGFPPPPHPGLWDPVSWWAHHTHQQAVHPYSFPGYGSGYAYPIPPVPPVGTNQRGFIKAPPGLSQKHQRFWEAQSMENVQLWATSMQLWATVARAEAEISCQRGKILKLETDLQTVKVQQDALVEASAAVAATQPARRRRAKKAAPTAPVGIVGLPTSQSTPLKTQGRKVATPRANAKKIDLAKTIKEEFEILEKEKATSVDQIPGFIDRATQDQENKCGLLTIGLDRSETGAERNSHTHKVECQDAGSENHRVNGKKDNLEYSRVNENSPFRSSLPLGVAKPGICEQTVEMEVALGGSFLKIAGNVEKQAVTPGDSGLKNESMGMSRRDDWLGTNVNAARNANLGSRMHAHCVTNSMERSKAISLGNAAPGLQYTAEDGSDEQDEVVASGQDDEEVDDDDETTLDDIGGKMGNYRVLESATAMSKDMTALGRW